MDYFACYFSSPEFGHPSVAAFHKLPTHLKPYGGTDTRLFMTRPHIAIMDDPHNRSSQTLLLETERGLYFHYASDTTASVKMDVNVFDAAAVVTRKYKAPAVGRGLRGSAGSGRGVRTLVEFLSAGYSYHFDVPRNHKDLLVTIYPKKGHNVDEFSPDTHTANTDLAFGTLVSSHPTVSLDDFGQETGAELPGGGVDLDAGHLKLPSVAVPYPTCIMPLSDTKGRLPPETCDIVTSYEDLLFIVSLVSDFIGIGDDQCDEEKLEADEATNSQKDSNSEKSSKDKETAAPPLVSLNTPKKGMGRSIVSRSGWEQALTTLCDAP
jgi:hypothetical protein